MSKKHTPKARIGRRRSPTPTFTAMPPLVLAIGRLIEGEDAGLHPDFVTAWTHMPAVVESYAANEDSACGRVTRHSILEEIIERTLSSSRAASDKWDRRFAEVTDLVLTHEAGVDALTDFYVPYTEAAFHIGVALAAYLLTVPAPVPLTRGGGAR